MYLNFNGAPCKLSIWAKHLLNIMFIKYTCCEHHIIVQLNSLNVCTNKICSEYGNVMIAKSKEDRKLGFPDFHLSGNVLSILSQVKHLGYFITDDLNKDVDIGRHCRKLVAQGNMKMLILVDIVGSCMLKEIWRCWYW